MRELKFRVWDLEYKEMLYGPINMISAHGKLYMNYKVGTIRVWLDDKYIIQQFTGLKDIKGKEIYEGDIVKLDNSPYVYKMIWADWRWGLESSDLDHIVSYTSAVQDRSEIIGNIFENPELLK